MYIEIENLEDDTIEVSKPIEIPKGLSYEEFSESFDAMMDAHLDNDSILEIE